MGAFAGRYSVRFRSTLGAKRAIWRAKPRQKCPKRHPLPTLGAKRAISGPAPLPKWPKRHLLSIMGAKRAIWRTKPRARRPKRHPLSALGANAICGGRFFRPIPSRASTGGAAVEPRYGWTGARRATERLAAHHEASWGDKNGVMLPQDAS